MKYLTFLLLIASFAVAQDEKPDAKPEAKPEAPATKNPVVVMKTSMGDIEIELFASEAPKTVANFVGLAQGTKEFTDAKTKEKVKRPYYDGIIFHRVIKDFMVQGGCPRGDGFGDPGYKFDNEISAAALGLDKKMVFTDGKPTPGLPLSQQEFGRGVVLPALQELKIDPTNREEIQKREPELVKIVEKMSWEQALENLGFKFNNDLKSHAPDRGCIAMANAGPGTNGSQFFIITRKGGTPPLAGKHTVFGKVTSGMDVADKISEVPCGAGDKPVEDVTIISIRLKEGSAAAPEVKEKPEKAETADEPEEEPDEPEEEPEDEPEEMEDPE